MKCVPVSVIKGVTKRPLRPEPSEGTHIREAWDLFKSHPGQAIEFRHHVRNSNILRQLTDFYGLDIRCVQNGNERTGRKSLYVLAGEWFGRVYVDYIAEHLESQS